VIDPSIRPGVMSNVARRANAEIYAELVRRLIAAERVEDGWLYASALAGVEDPKLASQLLALTLDDKVPSQIAVWIPGMISGSYVHADLAYAFARDNYAALSRRQTADNRPFVLSSAASGFNDAARAKTLIVDQKRLLGDAGDKAAKEGAAAIELKGRIKDRESGSIAARLSRITAENPY
jgi:ERAP1-like C-terminal domain